MPTRVGTYEMEIMEKKIKLGLIGLGHLGKIHLKCLKDTSFEIQGIFDVDQELCKTLAEAHNVKMYETGESLIEDCDAIDIVSPTTTHFYWAKKVLLANKHVFVEKPITADLDEAKEILDLYNTRSIKFQIGHVERFNPAFLSLKDKNLQPRFIEGHRLAPFNPRGNDVSVVLDLMIHDIDIVLSLVKSKVKNIYANGVSIVNESPDICNARIEFENGCVANLTASRISLKQMRKLRFFQNDAYVSIDFLKKESNYIKLHDSEKVGNNYPESWVNIETKKGTKLIEIEIPEVKEINSIQMELESFYTSITKNLVEEVTLQDAFDALQLAQSIVLRINNND